MLEKGEGDTEVRLGRGRPTSAAPGPVGPETAEGGRGRGPPGPAPRHVTRMAPRPCLLGLGLLVAAGGMPPAGAQTTTEPIRPIPE